MIEREKVIKGLECIVSSGNAGMRDDCANCIYPGGGDCLAPALQDALALLKAQEPRVMRMSEIVIHDGIMFVEDRDWLLLVALCHDEREHSFVFETWRLGGRKSYACAMYHRHDKKDYNKTWRCWTSRPTDEQREAVKWND